MRENRERYPELVALALELAVGDVLGAARRGTPLPEALAEHYPALERVAARVPPPAP